MADIRTFFDGEKLVGDYALDGTLLAADGDLETAVILCLFTDRRAEPDDTLSDVEPDKRGWFGDGVPVVEGDHIGSKLWLLARRKQTTETLNLAVEYCREALQWMIEDGVARAVEIEAEWVAMGVLGLRIGIVRPNIEPLRFKYDVVWRALA